MTPHSPHSFNKPKIHLAKIGYQYYNISMSKEITKKTRKNGIIELAVGAGVAALGGILSYISYDTAKVGEIYHTYIGLITFGIIYAGKGLIDLLFPNAFKKKQSSEKESEKTPTEAEAIVKEED